MKVSMIKIFELDDKIADIIIKLNEKGYNSEACCSGHSDESNSNPYIMFTQSASYMLKEYGVPDNWHKEPFSVLLISRDFTQEELDMLGKETCIDVAMKELANWVDKIDDYGAWNGNIFFEKDVDAIE